MHLEKAERTHVRVKETQSRLYGPLACPPAPSLVGARDCKDWAERPRKDDCARPKKEERARNEKGAKCPPNRAPKRVPRNVRKPTPKDSPRNAPRNSPRNSITNYQH